jgi:hypothetical protein
VRSHFGIWVENMDRLIRSQNSSGSRRKKPVESATGAWWSFAGISKKIPR